MNEWEKILNSERELFVFGASTSAYITTCQIGGWTDKPIAGYLVSKPNENPKWFNGKKVYSLSDFNEDEKCRMNVIISQSWEQMDSIEQLLRENGFVNIYASTAQMKRTLTDKDKEEVYSIYGHKKNCKPDFENKSCTIYAVTSHLNLHKQMKEYNSKYITYLQAGAALSDVDMCAVKDNTGENISEQNPYYCELTAGYWMAKNDKISDYLGLYHYSRGLDLTDGELELRLCGDDTMIIPYPYKSRYPKISSVGRLDGEIMQRGILSVYPDYKEAVEEFFSQCYFVPGNIMITSKAVFCEYYDWLMCVLERCNDLFRNTYQIPISKRVWGYYGEFLQNIFLIHNRGKYNISYANMKDMTV